MFDPKTQHDHTCGTTNFANKNCTNCPCDEEILQFRPNKYQESDDSGVCSPPLWKNNPSPNPSPPRSPSHPLLSHNSYKYCSSPNSRAKAIARGQRELMEMVKNMPESSYELSLKDLVDQHHHHNMENSNIGGPQLQNIGKNQFFQKRAVFVEVNKRQESKKSFENKGLFLKMGFPFNLQSKKMKKFGDSNNSSGKVLPKPDQKDWWKKKFTSSSDSDSSRISSNSGGSSSGRSNGGSQRKKHGFLTGCWPIFQSKSSKSVE